MSQTKLTRYVACLVISFMTIGISTASASEVTGTLSSAATDQTTNGNISGNVVGVGGNLSGTVTGGSNGGGGGGGGGTRIGGGSSSSNPPGQVLGASDSISSPSFPNAGLSPQTHTPTLWSSIVAFFTNLF